jgi:hypothetical protein
MRISRKERIRNVTIRQQIRLEKRIVKENEQNQLTWYGHVQRRPCSENGRRKITQNSIEVDAEKREHEADNLTTFMCRVSRNSGALTL